jgi:hypothetical protein
MDDAERFHDSTEEQLNDHLVRLFPSLNTVERGLVATLYWLSRTVNLGVNTDLRRLNDAEARQHESALGSAERRFVRARQAVEQSGIQAKLSPEELRMFLELTDVRFNESQ